MPKTGMYARLLGMNSYVSPFRYPGGKSWLTGIIRNWLLQQPVPPRLLVEPFAGGASVGLFVAAHKLTEHVILVEKDPDVAAVWETILTGNNKRFAQRVAEFDCNQRTVTQLLESVPGSVEDLAFQTLVKNRVSWGGVLTGAGIPGTNRGTFAARWYGDTLATRISNIGTFAHRITFLEGDGIPVLARYSTDPHTALFVDPPYTAGGGNAGKRLYKYSTVNHDHILEVISGALGPTLVTYNNTPEVKELALKHNLQWKETHMRTNQNTAATELLIGPNIRNLVNDNPTLFELTTT